MKSITKLPNPASPVVLRRNPQKEWSIGYFNSLPLPFLLTHQLTIPPASSPTTTMDLLQTVCRKGARPSLLALSTLRTAPTTFRSPFSTSRHLLAADQPPRPPPPPSQSEGIMRLRNNIRKTADARSLSPNSLFGGGPGPLRTGSSLGTGRSLDHFKELIDNQANQSLQPFEYEEFFNKHIHRTELEANLRLRPVTGRTVNVRHGDVSQALSQLGRRCAENKVKSDEIRQRFHERPALKRKRKLRERWRARFKEGVNAAISRTMVLRAQGW